MDFRYNREANLFSVWCAEKEVDALFETLTAFRHEHTEVFFIVFPSGKKSTECYDALDDAEQSIINTPPQYREQGAYTVCKALLADFLADSSTYEEVKTLSFDVR